MSWVWEKPDWPNFTYDSTALEPLEKRFLLQSGEFIGAVKHIGADDQDILKIEIISDEAVKTSEIEGEILNRDSVQSSLRHQLGLGAERPGIMPAERGITKMMVDLCRGFADALADTTMFDWHRMLLSGDRSVRVQAVWKPNRCYGSLAESRGDDEGFRSRGGSPADDAVAGMPR